MRLVRVVAIAVAIAALHEQLLADEVWTFQFTPNSSRPFSSQALCDCIYDFEYRADIAGTFSILLNRQTGFGKPLKLNGSLANFVQVVHMPDGPSINPLESFIPLPSEVALDQLPGHFSYQQNGLWRLVPDDASQMAFYHSYDIWFTLTAATFSANIEANSFWLPRVDEAFASLVGITAAGDFNADSRVDARDYVSLRKSASTPTNYNLWRTYYGTGSVSGMSNDPVPEPFTLALLGIGAMSLLGYRKAKSSR